MTQPRKTLTKAASLNALAAGLDYGARLLIGLIVTPILVTGLGDFLFGVWQMLGRVAGYLSVAGGRANQALKNAIANRQASDDYEEKRQLVASSLVVWAMFVPVLSVIGVFIVWLIPNWVDAPRELLFDVRFATAIVIANLVLVNLSLLPQSVLQGENLMYKRMGLSTALIIIGGVLVVLAIELDTGIPGVAFAYAGQTVLTGALFVPIVRANVPWFGIARVSFRRVMAFLRLSSLFLAWRFVMQAMVASDVIILGIMVSPEAVTGYTLTKFAPQAMVGMVALIVTGVTPGLGGIIGTGDLAKAARVRAEMMAGTWLIATAIGGTILLWNRAFMGLWVGSERYAGSLATFLIILLVTQQLLFRNDANIIDLTLKLGTKVALGLLSALVSVVLAVVFVNTFDDAIIGLVVGFLLGRSILTVAYPWLVGKAFDIPFGTQVRGVVRPVLASAAVFGVAVTVGHDLVSTTWINFVLGAGVSLLTILGVAFYAGLSSDQRESMRTRARLAVPGGGTR